MAKQQSNGFVRVVWVPTAGVVNPQFPTVAELNAGVDLSAAIAWEDYEIGMQGSDDIEDRAITDLGNAISRGTANYGATLDFFRDKNNTDATSIYRTAFETFRTNRVSGYLITRVSEKVATAAWAAGDNISVFKLMAVTSVDVTSGDTSTKFQVNFLPQGVAHPYTMVAGAGAITVAATLSVAVGASRLLTPTLASKSIRSRATYTSADTTKATVSNHGVVTGVASTGAGTVTITTSYGAGTSGSTAVTVA